MPKDICRHIRPSGRRCQTFALRGHSHCHFHQALLEKHNGDVPAFLNVLAVAPQAHLDPTFLATNPLLRQYYGIRPSGPSDIDLPPLEDRDSIQIAISTILNACAQNRVDHRRAGTLLYGLQLAIANLNAPYRTERDNAPIPTTSIAEDEPPLLAAP